MQFQADLVGQSGRDCGGCRGDRARRSCIAGLAVGVWPDAKRSARSCGARALRAEDERLGAGGAPRRLAARARPRHDGPVTWVIAHRGASGDERENTLPAFERAIEMGADYVEFDVQASRDGGLVVFHDLRLDRLTSLRGPLRGAFAGGAAGGRDPDPRGGARADRRTDRGHGRAEEPVALPSSRHRAADGGNCSAPTRSWSRSPDARSSRRDGCGRRCARCSTSATGRRSAPRGGFAWAVGFDDSRVTTRGLTKAHQLGLRRSSTRSTSRDATARAAGARRRRDLRWSSGSSVGNSCFGQAEQPGALRREAPRRPSCRP